MRRLVATAVLAALLLGSLLAGRALATDDPACPSFNFSRDCATGAEVRWPGPSQGGIEFGP